MSKKNIGYKVTRYIGKRVRNNIQVLPSCKYNDTIILLIYKFVEKILKLILNFVSFVLTGLFYKKGKDSPIKGSILYMLFYILLAILSVKFFSELFVNFRWCRIKMYVELIFINIHNLSYTLTRIYGRFFIWKMIKHWKLL